MDQRIFKAYDVRGIYPQAVDEQVAWRVGHAAAHFLRGEIVVGRDCRASSHALSRALIAGMQAAGVQVVDIGAVDTPLVGFTVRGIGAAGGVQVTASHNPAQYNGFKVCGPGARPVGSETGLCDIEAYARAVTPPERSACTTLAAGVRAHDPWPTYRAHLMQFMHPDLVRGACHLRVVVDASNGMAGTMFPRVFGGVAGLTIIPIHFDNEHGIFVHDPNPLVEANLRWVRDAVRTHSADFGVCFDGDADRCMVVDEHGDVVGCDVVTAWLARTWLRRCPGAPIVFDLRSSRAVRETITADGGVPVECRVGHVFMKQRLREVDAPFGGELSGHFYYRDMGFTDNAARAFLDILQARIDGGAPLSACVAPFRSYYQSGEVNFHNPDTAGAIGALRARYPHAVVHTLDGVTLDCGDWWCNVRASNTEPLLRLNLEARTAALRDARVQDVAALLGTPAHG